MIHAIFQSHPHLALVGLIVLFFVVGYGESRVFPSKPYIACLTWLWGLLILTFVVADVRALGVLGPILAVVVLASGVAWISLFYLERKNPTS
jgi:hypothetical protein